MLNFLQCLSESIGIIRFLSFDLLSGDLYQYSHVTFAGKKLVTAHNPVNTLVGSVC